MRLCVPGAHPAVSATATQWSLRLVVGLAAFLSFGPSIAKADDAAVYLFVNQCDGNSWAIEGWVFCDDPAGLPVTITGLPDGSTVTAYTDETGYFLYFVELDSPATITATVTDNDLATASDSYVVN